MLNVTKVRAPGRWLMLACLLAVAWLASPHPVPLYDGIGFPDEPYRFVPPRSGTGPATSAEVRLRVAGGVNTGGLIANSAEIGPQVSIYAPPRAFAVGGAAPIVVSAKPVPLTGTPPPGTVDSNVYTLSLTSADGAVRVVPAAQPPQITLRSALTSPLEPVFEYRPTAAAPWQELKTRLVGRDISNADAPGAGDYVLVLLTGGQAAAAPGAGHTGLYIVLGATAALMALVLIGIRIVARRGEQQ